MDARAPNGDELETMKTLVAESLDRLREFGIDVETLAAQFEERVAQLKARMKESQGFRVKVEPVLPMPDPTKTGPPAKAPTPQ